MFEMRITGIEIVTEYSMRPSAYELYWKSHN
jgi:hypothetical protein